MPVSSRRLRGRVTYPALRFLEWKRLGGLGPSPPVPSYTVRQQASREQAIALGFTQMVAEVPPAGRA